MAALSFADRLTQVFIEHEDGKQHSTGSGFLLRDGLVITARHVLVPDTWRDKARITITARPLFANLKAKEGWLPAELVWPTRDELWALPRNEIPDVALIRLNSFSRESSGDDSLLGLGDPQSDAINVVAVGFPAWKKASEDRQETHQILGVLKPYSSLVSRTYEIEQLELGNNNGAELSRALDWRGFSGAALFTSPDHRRLIGVLVTHAQNGPFEFRAVRLDALVQGRGDFAKAIRPQDPSAPIRDWGQETNLDLSQFAGREEELNTASAWLKGGKARLVEISGLPGVGKTFFAVMLARRVEASFDVVVWRQVRADSLPTLFKTLLDAISGGRLMYQENKSAIQQILSCFASRRCLVLLDAAEIAIQSGNDAACQDFLELIQGVAERAHPSCLVLISQQQNPALERYRDQVRQRLEITGLDVNLIRNLAPDLKGSDADWQNLTGRFSGNPYAVVLAAAVIRGSYNSSISEFLKHPLDIAAKLIKEQLQSFRERDERVIWWLALARTAIKLEDYYAARYLASRSDLVETLGVLKRLHLLQPNPAELKLQNIVSEYVTSLIIETIAAEILEERPAKLKEHELLRPEAAEYVREAQAREIVQPILDQLQERLGDTDQVLRKLTTMLHGLRDQQAGHAPGNLIQLLAQLKVELTGFDFSRLKFESAYLRGIPLRQVDFTSTQLKRSAFFTVLSGVLCVALSGDDKILATGDVTGRIALWDASTGMKLFNAPGHEGTVWSLAFSPDAQIVASCGHDGLVRLWNYDLQRALPTLAGHDGYVTSILFHPEGPVLVSGGGDGTVRLWNLVDGRLLKTQPAHDQPIHGLAMSADGKLLASASSDNTVRLWDIILPAEIRPAGPPLQHSAKVFAVAFHSVQPLIASGGEDRRLWIWDVSNPQAPRALASPEAHARSLSSIAFHPQSPWLASASHDGTVKAWDLQQRSQPRSGRIYQGHRSGVNRVVFSKTGDTLVTGGSDLSARVWDSATGESRRVIEGYVNWINAICFIPGTSRLATASSDWLIRLWDVNSRAMSPLPEKHLQSVNSIAASPDGLLLASGGKDCQVWLWDLRQMSGSRIGSHDDEVTGITFSPDGESVVSGSHRQLKWWNLVYKKSSMTFEGFGTWQGAVAFSPDGRWLAATRNDNGIQICRIAGRAWFDLPVRHKDSVRCLAFRRDGAVLASGGGGRDKTIRLWDMEKASEIGPLGDEKNGHHDWISSVAMHPESDVLASSGGDSKVKLWDMKEQRLIREHGLHQGWVNSVAFSPWGSHLASAGRDGAVYLWDITSSDLKYETIQNPGPYDGMNIQGVTGLTPPQMEDLIMLGARK